MRAVLMVGFVILITDHVQHFAQLRSRVKSLELNKLNRKQIVAAAIVSSLWIIHDIFIPITNETIVLSHVNDKDVLKLYAMRLHYRIDNAVTMRNFNEVQKSSSELHFKVYWTIRQN